MQIRYYIKKKNLISPEKNNAKTIGIIVNIINIIKISNKNNNNNCCFPAWSGVRPITLEPGRDISATENTRINYFNNII